MTNWNDLSIYLSIHPSIHLFVCGNDKHMVTSIWAPYFHLWQNIYVMQSETLYVWLNWPEMKNKINWIKPVGNYCSISHKKKCKWLFLFQKVSKTIKWLYLNDSTLVLRIILPAVHQKQRRQSLWGADMEPSSIYVSVYLPACLSMTLKVLEKCLNLILEKGSRREWVAHFISCRRNSPWQSPTDQKAVIHML